MPGHDFKFPFKKTLFYSNLFICNTWIWVVVVEACLPININKFVFISCLLNDTCVDLSLYKSDKIEDFFCVDKLFESKLFNFLIWFFKHRLWNELLVSFTLVSCYKKILLIAINLIFWDNSRFHFCQFNNCLFKM